MHRSSSPRCDLASVLGEPEQKSAPAHVDPLVPSAYTVMLATTHRSLSEACRTPSEASLYASAHPTACVVCGAALSVGQVRRGARSCGAVCRVRLSRMRRTEAALDVARQAEAALLQAADALRQLRTLAASGAGLELAVGGRR